MDHDCRSKTMKITQYTKKGGRKYPPVFLIDRHITEVKMRKNGQLEGMWKIGLWGLLLMLMVLVPVAGSADELQTLKDQLKIRILSGPQKNQLKMES